MRSAANEDSMTKATQIFFGGMTNDQGDGAENTSDELARETSTGFSSDGFGERPEIWSVQFDCLENCP